MNKIVRKHQNQKLNKKNKLLQVKTTLNTY